MIKNQLLTIFQRYKNSLLFASGTFIVQGINAITLPIFTRLLTQSDYGVLSASNSVQDFSTAIFRLGTQQAVLKQYAEYSENEKRQYLFSVILFSLSWSLILFVFFLFLNFIFGISLFDNVAFFPYLTIAILTASFSTSYALFQSYLRVLNLSRKFILVTVVYVLLSITLSLIFITKYELGALGKLLGGFIPYLLIFCYIFIRSFSKFKIKYWVEAIRFGYPLAISSIIFSLVMIYTFSYLSQNVSLRELGIYHIGRNLGLLIPDFLFQSLILTYQPFIYNKLRENNISSITYQNNFIIIGLLVAILITVIFAKSIILLFTTHEYLESLSLMRIFLFSYFFRILYYFPMIYIFFNNNTFLYTKIELFSLGIFLILIHLLVPEFSIEGIGIAIIIQEFVKLILIIIFSKLRIVQIMNFRKINT
ncbi:lipopolysaccharide biosynthesis protein [Algoriphagus yeomjeoni]|uniref:O-antigen/teichoic acid export membrane protein n=1 Tax=Algoriphagus yeomjeoni TaxID=291403 RepID=A0A327PJW0_9BACT|nr:oligosaccharide flippase family protein [Algoriphagus yeomjeoni]RAI91661.1 O-antigen/teichoic acid export membrane protein [Algoriphagus yeomjeoni]